MARLLLMDNGDPYAFTSNEKLVGTLRGCLENIKNCLSDDAYLQLQKNSFWQFQTAILSNSKNLPWKRSNLSCDTVNSVDQLSTGPPSKQQRIDYFNKGMKIIV